MADTARSAYRVLEARATLTTITLLLTLAAFAWWSTVTRAGDMAGMVSGLGSVGIAMMPFDMSAVTFLAMWATMMVAMMFPTVAPIVLLHRLVVRRRRGSPVSTAVFAGGYLTVWTVIGLVPLAALIAFRSVAHGSEWVAPLSGAVLLVCGAYQFTRWKEACQRACRSPMAFLITHDFGVGIAGAFRAGLAHGAYCFGCCWALMAVLFVVGLMNVVWMAGIAVVFLLEKHWQHGPALVRVVGTLVIGLGLTVLIEPSVLASISS